MKKKTIHFSWFHNSTCLTACGADSISENLEITSLRKKVTCKTCKRTKRFRKIK